MKYLNHLQITRVLLEDLLNVCDATFFFYESTKEARKNNISLMLIHYAIDLFFIEVTEILLKLCEASQGIWLLNTTKQIEAYVF